MTDSNDGIMMKTNSNAALTKIRNDFNSFDWIHIIRMIQSNESRNNSLSDGRVHFLCPDRIKCSPKKRPSKNCTILWTKCTSNTRSYVLAEPFISDSKLLSNNILNSTSFTNTHCNFNIGPNKLMNISVSELH